MTKKDVTHLSYSITGMAIKVHKTLGPGLLESVYEECLKYELLRNGHLVQSQLKVPVIYEEIELETEFRIQGLLINFFTNKITKGLKPFVNEYFTALQDE